MSITEEDRNAHTELAHYHVPGDWKEFSFFLLGPAMASAKAVPISLGILASSFFFFNFLLDYRFWGT